MRGASVVSAPTSCELHLVVKILRATQFIGRKTLPIYSFPLPNILLSEREDEAGRTCLIIYCVALGKPFHLSVASLPPLLKGNNAVKLLPSQ